MANSVFISIATAGVALALTATIATPSMAMSFNDYDRSSAPVGSRAEVGELFAGRLLSTEQRRDREFEQLQEIRRNRGNGDGVRGLPARSDSRPISLTLPF